jgi:hypothetical protein
MNIYGCSAWDVVNVGIMLIALDAYVFYLLWHEYYLIPPDYTRVMLVNANRIIS